MFKLVYTEFFVSSTIYNKMYATVEKNYDNNH